MVNVIVMVYDCLDILLLAAFTTAQSITVHQNRMVFPRVLKIMSCPIATFLYVSTTRKEQLSLCLSYWAEF
jgi:hypothetical protein